MNHERVVYTIFVLVLRVFTYTNFDHHSHSHAGPRSLGRLFTSRPSSHHYSMRNILDTRLLVLESMLKSLADPLNPRTCAFVLIGGVATLEERFEHDASGVQLDAFRDVAVSWVTAPRTRGEMDDLRASLKCECCEEEQSTGSIEQFMHRAGQYRFGKSDHTLPMQAAIFGLLYPLSHLKAAYQANSSLYRLRNPRLRESTARLLRRKVPWPYTAQQLLPHGPESSVRGLVSWLRTEMDPTLRTQIYHSIEALLSLCGPTIPPYLVTSPTFVRAVLDGLETTHATYFRSPHDPHIQRNTIRHLTAVGILLHKLWRHSHRATRISITHHCPEELLTWSDRSITVAEALISAAPNLFTSPLSETYEDFLCISLESFSEVAALVHHAHPRLQHQILRNPKIKRHDYNHVHMQGTVWIGLHQVLLDLNSTRYCLAPSCGKSFSEAGRRFRYCTGCRRVPYCSIDCQKIAWKHALSHKHVCLPLRTICLRFDVSRTRNLSHFDSDMDENYAPQAQAVVSHFVALIQHKLKMPSTFVELHYLVAGSLPSI
jgi:hypothetical protein